MEVSENVTYEEAEKDYIARWSLNAKQHFDDGDYEWLCGFIKNHISESKGIVEVGCGAGYSTLTYAKNGFNVVAFDINEQAIEVTDKLLRAYGLREQTLMVQGDVVHQSAEIVDFLKRNKLPHNIIVLCNPGGDLSAHVTEREKKLLRDFGFVEAEIRENNVPLLHKWALIYAACLLAITTDKMLVIVERGTKMELEFELEQIAEDTGIRKRMVDFRKIKREPKGGIPLGKTDSEQYWGVALYYPR